MDLHDLRLVCEAHRSYWQTQRETMRKFTRVYSNRMWADVDRRIPGRVLVETSDGYSYVESYVASLFARRPSVAVAAGPDETGDPILAEGLANRFLYNQVDTVEDLVRFGLLYPFCGLKLGVIPRANILDQVEAQCVRPWDLIVDMDASKWDLMRYVGHRYYMPLPAAIAKWGRKRWKSAIRQDYLDQRSLPTGLPTASATGSGDGGLPREAARTMTTPGDGRSVALSYVEIVELYDMVEDQMFVWSPNLDSAEGLVEKHSPIPLRKADGGPMAPIVGLFMSHDPHVPLRGASTLGRVYDQLYETNQLRTYWANAVRRDSRMYVARKDSLDEKAKQVLTENLDQSVVEISSITANQSISDVIVPLPSQVISVDFDRYKADIQRDLERGSITAPFTRGQATNATATEVAALTQYTSSEIGRMARRRDLAIEAAAEIYVRMLATLLAEDPDRATAITIEGKRLILTSESLEGNFRYAAADQASTPISAAVRKQRILELVPTLTALGVSNGKLLELIQREFDLPAELLERDAPSPTMLPSGDTAPSPGMGAEPLPVGGGAVAAGVRADGPSPSIPPETPVA